MRAVARWATGEHAIPGTAGAHTPFLSPDNQWVGFSPTASSRKAPIAGGPVVAVADLKSTDRVTPSALASSQEQTSSAPAGSEDGTIVFEPIHRRLVAGARRRWDTFAHDDNAEQRRTPAPHHLPGGRGVLLTLSDARDGIAVLPRGRDRAPPPDRVGARRPRTSNHRTSSSLGKAC